MSEPERIWRQVEREWHGARMAALEALLAELANVEAAFAEDPGLGHVLRTTSARTRERLSSERERLRALETEEVAQ